MLLCNSILLFFFLFLHIKTHFCCFFNCLKQHFGLITSAPSFQSLLIFLFCWLTFKVVCGLKQLKKHPGLGNCWQQFRLLSDLTFEPFRRSLFHFRKTRTVVSLHFLCGEYFDKQSWRYVSFSYRAQLPERSRTSSTKATSH